MRTQQVAPFLPMIVLKGQSLDASTYALHITPLTFDLLNGFAEHAFDGISRRAHLRTKLMQGWLVWRKVDQIIVVA